MPRERFGRGRGRGRRNDPEAEAQPPVEQPPVDEPADGPQPFHGRARGSRGGRGRRDRVPGLRTDQAPPAPPPSRREPARGIPGGGSVESLIARQNVLFEEFTGQQQQMLREIQRSVMGRGGSSNAVAPIVLPRVGVFLDVPNLVFAADDSGVRIHFGKLLEYLTQGRQLVRATAYAPITDDPNTRFENQRFVHPVLGYGYKVVTKPWKRFADGGMKANFDIELAVDILTMSDRLDIVILMSGDSDFKRVIELVESKGVRVEVCAFAQSTAAELRAVADQYIDLGSILHIVGG
ncbi:MAG TPA: NYN domain-containing protein [Dehalococcoidia bacterium]